MAAKKEDFAGQQSLLNKELKEGTFRRAYLLYGEQVLAGRSAKTQAFVRAYAEELSRNS